MQKYSSKNFIVFLLLLFSVKGFAQLSQRHYIPPLTNALDETASPSEQFIYISTPSNTDVSYTIMPVGEPPENYITGNVSNANPATIAIGAGPSTQLFIPAASTSSVFDDKGYIIEAAAPVYVSIRMIAGNGFQAGALVSKGVSALGNTFRVGAFSNEANQGSLLNFVSVMATEDDTQIAFSDIPTGTIIENYTGSLPINITLNEGESYIIATERFDKPINAEALIGALVSSNKPIVVNCGSANGSFGPSGGRDYGIDQIVGVDKVGSEYIFVRGNGLDEFENILIVAHTNNTTVNVNNGGNIATLNAGEHLIIEGDNYSSNGNMYVETNNPVFAYQGIGGTESAANQGLFFVPPISCESRGNIENIPDIDFIGTTEFIEDSGVSIVTRVGADVRVRSSNSSATIALGRPSPVEGNSLYETYRLTDLRGNITIEGNDELYVAYFNVSGAATSGSFYSGFPSIPEISFDSNVQTFGNCVPVRLVASNENLFDSFEWQIDTGSGFATPTGGNNTQPNFMATEPGTYRLITRIDCTNETFESVQIPLPLCPEDTDGDGIINNLDVDNDNDGIPNCTESLGNVSIDLSNISAPVLTFQDGTQNSSIASSSVTSVTAGNTPNTGNFRSTIAGNSNLKNNLTLNFTEPVNIRFDEDTVIPHTPIDQEIFSVQILPSNLNITLVDPDNRLLIDSDFDGVFETGIAQISGSQIRFKINPTPRGSTPFAFFANQVDAFIFTHEAPGATQNSVFNGFVNLTCFTRDSDGDGVKDEFDLDSDNDAVPDFIEHQGTFVPLSGVDDNSDGLDNIYDINATSIDTDTDGIVDVFDVDSDNDGITDLFETSAFNTSITGLIDANSDGIIDTGANFGANGWVDTMETTPDSGLLNAGINLDPDGDTVFSQIDADSDGDNCNDVTEAGFPDPDEDGVFGTGIPTVNPNTGMVTAATGVPDPDYAIAAPITISQQPQFSTLPVCENANTTASILFDTPITSIQWQISTDGGVTWNNLADDANYSGTNTTNLNIINTPLTFNNFQYRTNIQRAGNSCGLISNPVTLMVSQLPVINTPRPTDLVQCDDDDAATLGFSIFNLNEANSEISSNASNETFTYYETEAAARIGDESAVDFITDPIAYENQTNGTDTVWARVVNSAGCFEVAEVQLTVAISAALLNNIQVQEFFECDDFIDADNGNRDGIATFDFSSADALIRQELNNQGRPDLTPIYFRSLEDALSELNAIPDAELSTYRNTTPNAQSIYVRVDDANGSNDCLGLRALIELNVEALPVANPVTVTPLCDDNSNDGIEVFDTSNLETTLLGSQNPSDVNITYLTINSQGQTQALRDSNGTVINSPFPNSFSTTTQTIIARVTNTTTADPDGPCFDETSITFTIDRQPIANPLADQVVCDGDAGDLDTDDFFPFDTSDFSSTVLGNQTGFDIRYNYTDENGTVITDSPTLPNPLVSANQTLQIDVINPSNTTCIASTMVSLIVNPLPEFQVESPRIVCTSDPTFQVDLEPLETDPTEVFTYEWLRSSLDNSVTNEFISNNRSITVSTPGIYTITLTKTDGTACSRSREIVVDASEIANLTEDAVTIVDLSNNNSVTVDPTNLGMGNYEYALQPEEELGSSPIFQDSPVFNNLRAGFYTLFVREEICGTVTLDVAVIGRPSFFTPNGDGFNDLWQIRGISSTNKPDSVVFIYDRYGKLLKQLLASSNGWDGTFNGQPMPTDDYWFNVTLEDGRSLTGHFTLKR